MIVSDSYPLDDNTALKDIQHDLYGRLAGQIYGTAREQLILAAEILDIEAQLVDQAKACNHFDHRALQDAHDLMAAGFRMERDDGGQLHLFETQAERLARYRDEWVDWFHAELAQLNRNPRFVRSAVLSIVLDNTRMGFVAQEDLRRLLSRRYEVGAAFRAARTP